MKVLILGADGYLGWPTCMYFSRRGHEVMGVDNYFRRGAAVELDCEPLFPTPNLIRRAEIWEKLSRRTIEVRIGDATDYGFLNRAFEDFRPEVVVHYAEQPSAPYSMVNRDKAALTLTNNLLSTLNIIHAVHESSPDCHIIKLGTMGEYGTPNIDIEEGWLEIEHKGRKDKFLFPRQASSLYHTTKIQDTDLLWFYVRTWGISVTDLMQGPVYGLSTEEANLDESLMPNFNYDEIFGTVLNRFIVQAVAGHPLTIYGRGGQIRGYINLKDTLQCVYLSALNPARRGELRIFNQVTETFSVNELAEKVTRVGEKLGYSVRSNYLPNPRIEKEEHYYNPTYTGLLELGLEPHYLTHETLSEMFQVVEKYKDNINMSAIYRGVKWHK
ncbi:MAG: NAD-dependent epimerase/dehydratase family protein [Deltaproteobacteria bacterium]|nr:NAD-dependent epimerase/dehydratase family protein [Deltaproteobacteria bacterium]